MDIDVVIIPEWPTIKGDMMSGSYEIDRGILLYAHMQWTRLVQVLM